MSEAQKQWFRERIQAIHQRVSVYDVLRAGGVDLKQSTDDREEQFSCPFHGEDKKPSARVFPPKDVSPGHAWCYVCQERWDAISLWQKFNGLTFGQALSRLERDYNLPTIERAAGLFEGPVNEKKAAFQKLYDACEARLLACKPVYQKQQDMQGFLNASSVLDRTKHRVESGAWRADKGCEVLRSLLDRMLEKMKACPAG